MNVAAFIALILAIIVSVWAVMERTWQLILLALAPTFHTTIH